MSENAILRAALAERAAVPRLLALLPADAVAGLDPTRLRPLAVDHIGRSGRAQRGDIAWAVGTPTTREPNAKRCWRWSASPRRIPAWRCA